MLILKVLNPSNQKEIPSFTFYAGEAKPISVQVYDTDEAEEANIPAALINKTLTLTSHADVDIIITGSNVIQDLNTPSIFSASLTAEQINLMQTGNVSLVWSKGGSTHKAVGQLKIKKITSIL
jgi:hypothetical protein